jgi:hypothetical protein
MSVKTFFVVGFYLLRAVHIFDLRLVVNYKINIGNQYEKKSASVCSEAR